MQTAVLASAKTTWQQSRARKNWLQLKFAFAL
jgi:hypothetical protein